MSLAPEIIDVDIDTLAKCICEACGEKSDYSGDARGNEFRWQDYREVADDFLVLWQEKTKTELKKVFDF